jgi:hypothetical protein
MLKYLGTCLPRQSGQYKLIEGRPATVVITPEKEVKTFRGGWYSARKWRALKWIDERERRLSNAQDS